MKRKTEDWDRKLVDTGYALDARAKKRAGLYPLLLVLSLFVLGVSKIVVGLSRGKPVGFLVFLVLGYSFVTLAFAKGPRLTNAGTALFKSLKGRVPNSYPLTNEPIAVAQLVALHGTMALVGTPLAAFGVAFAGQSGSGGGGCGGGGDGGGCGGGCGGCGGD